MKNTLVVVTDLGGFKAYRLDDDRMNSNPRLELLESFNNTSAQQKLVEQVTDMAGRFPRAKAARDVTVGGMAQGERHNMKLEIRKRAVRRLAGKINSLMLNDGIEQCWLAASREMNRQLLEELDPQARAKIGLNVPADLMKVNKSDLLRHFR